MVPEEKLIHIYYLSHPETGEIKYIGKANDIQKRFKSHLRDAKRRHRPVCKWIRELLAIQLVPKITLIKSVPFLEWEQAEKDAIAEYRKTHKLLNLADGGSHIFTSLEDRRKQGRSSAIKRQRTPESRKLWFLKQQMGVMLKKGILSEKNKEKLRIAARKCPSKFGLWAHI